MNKKAFVTVHAGMFFTAGVIIGALATWWLISNGYIPVSVPAAN